MIEAVVVVVKLSEMQLKHKRLLKDFIMNIYFLKSLKVNLHSRSIIFITSSTIFTCNVVSCVNINSENVGTFSVSSIVEAMNSFSAARSLNNINYFNY